MKKKEELNFDIDMESVNELMQSVSSQPINNLVEENTNKVKYRARRDSFENEEELISCLKNEKVLIKYIPQDGKITDKKHPMWGGMGDNSKFIISVPRLKSGSFANVLTNAEKKYLEYIMGLEDNALSVYNRTNNYWSNNTEGGISKVILFKNDNYLDLSDPEDYIRYKILLACKDLICPDIQTLKDKPKATYRFVIVSDTETNNLTKMNYTDKADAFVEYKKIDTLYNKLKAILEMVTMKTVSNNVNIDYLQTAILQFIDENPKDFLYVIRDKYLDFKVLIKQAESAGIIAKRANNYYLRSTNEPLCEVGEEATFTIAAKYLSLPKNLETLFFILGKLKEFNN